MTSYELNFAQDHQAAMLRESMKEQWLREARLGQPSKGQRMVVAAGEALEAAGGWLKRRGAADRGYAGIPVLQ
ncbi:MAG: hypothetical protein KA003_13370 [Caldilineaceae bacterium]|nr:hypothetical protein [Caldilineaceae bacterium]MBP8123034.1 hypothetical protein [Caldilineaceae bacterium]